MFCSYTQTFTQAHEMLYVWWEQPASTSINCYFRDIFSTQLCHSVSYACVFPHITVRMQTASVTSVFSKKHFRVDFGRPFHIIIIDRSLSLLTRIVARYSLVRLGFDNTNADCGSKSLAFFIFAALAVPSNQMPPTAKETYAKACAHRICLCNSRARANEIKWVNFLISFGLGICIE